MRKVEERVVTGRFGDRWLKFEPLTMTHKKEITKALPNNND